MFGKYLLPLFATGFLLGGGCITETRYLDEKRLVVCTAERRVKHYSLVVDSDPPGADVYLFGKKITETPALIIVRDNGWLKKVWLEGDEPASCRFIGFAPKEFLLEIKEEGYLGYIDTVKLSEETIRIDAKLIREEDVH